jgi:hypothetical protein
LTAREHFAEPHGQGRKSLLVDGRELGLNRRNRQPRPQSPNRAHRLNADSDSALVILDAGVRELEWNEQVNGSVVEKFKFGVQDSRNRVRSVIERNHFSNHIWISAEM